jgi:hypothetical protein
MDDWEAKYWANRAAQLQQQRGMQPQRPQYQQPTRPQIPEVDVAGMIMQRAMMQQPQNGSTPVYLREGANYYRQIQNPDGWGTTTTLIRSMGALSGVANKEFAIMGEMRAYCVDDLPSIDLSKINEQPQRMKDLVRVRAPFAGDLLVERSAIVNGGNNVSYGGKSLLKG